MKGERFPLSPRSRMPVAALPFVLAAACVLLFDVVREIPVSYGCGESAPAGHDDVVAAYRSGALVLHLLTIGAALGALALLGAGLGGGPLGVSWPTLVAFAAMVVLGLLAVLFDPVALVVFLPLLLIVIGIATVAGPFGAQATGVVAVLLLAGAAVWARRAVAAGHTVAVRTALWALVVLAGAHLLLVYFQGDKPAFC